MLRLSDLRIREQLIGALDNVVETAGAPPAANNEQARRMQRLLTRQVERLQTRAMELILEQKMDRAADELREGSELLLALLELSPGDVQLDTQLGYLYKTVAQTFDLADDEQMADRYIELAATAFQRVLKSPAEENVTEIASALNGLADIFSRRGQYDEAITLYQRAVATEPSYATAWHDLFTALELRAQQGRIDVDLMRQAVEQVRATGLGQPGLSADYIDDLQRQMLDWESMASQHPERVDPVENTTAPAEADLNGTA